MGRVFSYVFGVLGWEDIIGPNTFRFLFHEETGGWNHVWFSSFYYNIPKEIQPLENAAKLYYATTFPPELYFLHLDRKLVTLQHMFIDSLEVEDNLRMSKKNSDQDSGDKMEKKLDLVEQHKQKKHSMCISNLLLVDKEMISPMM